jgi:hypothetical protein
VKNHGKRVLIEAADSTVEALRGLIWAVKILVETLRVFSVKFKNVSSQI